MLVSEQNEVVPLVRRYSVSIYSIGFTCRVLVYIRIIYCLAPKFCNGTHNGTHDPIRVEWVPMG